MLTYTDCKKCTESANPNVCIMTYYKRLILHSTGTSSALYSAVIPASCHCFSPLVTNLKKQKKYVNPLTAKNQAEPWLGLFPAEHAHKHKAQQASYKRLGSSVMCTLPNEGEESMCVLKVNGLLSGGQSHCSCSAAQRTAPRKQTGGVDDHKKGDKLCDTLHCDFIFLLFILADKIKKVSFSLSLPEAINYAK